MKLQRLESGLQFESEADRTVAIDLLIRDARYSDLIDSFSMQKTVPGLFLAIPDPAKTEAEQTLEDYNPKTPKIVAPPNEGTPTDYRKNNLDQVHQQASAQLRQTVNSEWLAYWSDTFDGIKSDATNYLESGADLESVNRMLWTRVRWLVTQAGYDSFRMRSARYRASNNGKALNRLQRLMWWVRGKYLSWKMHKKKILYGGKDRYDTDLPHDPDKVVAIKCGYCGSEVQDDSVRPSPQEVLGTQRFKILKADAEIQIEAHNTVMKYKIPRKCSDCGEELQYAFICKVVRSVTAVLL